MTKNRLHELLDQALVRKGEKRRAQAQAIGVHIGTLYRWIRGETAPQASQWYRLGKYLERDPLELEAECAGVTP